MEEEEEGRNESGGRSRRWEEEVPGRLQRKNRPATMTAKGKELGSPRRVLPDRPTPPLRRGSVYFDCLDFTSPSRKACKGVCDEF